MQNYDNMKLVGKYFLNKNDDRNFIYKVIKRIHTNKHYVFRIEVIRNNHAEKFLPYGLDNITEETIKRVSEELSECETQVCLL